MYGILGPHTVGDSIRGEIFEQGHGTALNGKVEHRLRHTDGLEVEFTPEAERTVAEERQGDDRAVEDVRRVDVRDDTPAWLIVIDDGGVDEVGRHLEVTRDNKL